MNHDDTGSLWDAKNPEKCHEALGRLKPAGRHEPRGNS